MKFGDIIRQPLPVATFTFLVVVIVAFVRAWVTQRFAGEIPAVSAPLGYYTAAFRLSWPLLSAAASIVMLFVAGFLIGRSSVRAELYATRCFLAMPLFGVVSCGVLLSSDYLTQSLTLLLLALASRNYYNSFHRHYCFDRMFRGSLYVGLIPLLYAPGAGLLLLIPLVVLLFRRTLREAVVARTDGAVVTTALYFATLDAHARHGGEDLFGRFHPLGGRREIRRPRAAGRSGDNERFRIPIFRREYALFAHRMGSDFLFADLFCRRRPAGYPYAEN